MFFVLSLACFVSSEIFSSFKKNIFFRLRIAQEIQREQEEIEVKLKDLEARGVLLEKALRGEEQNAEV